MQSKTIDHNGCQYVLERGQAVGSLWQVYRVTVGDREWVAAGEYLNDLRAQIYLGRYEPRS